MGVLRARNENRVFFECPGRLEQGPPASIGIYRLQARFFDGRPDGQSGIGNSLTADQQLLLYKRVKCIEGTSDVLPNDRQYLDLYATAWKYAETYNKELLRRIRAGTTN